nr:hypothetical protein [Tanacetum cinerariifolium]
TLVDALGDRQQAAADGGGFGGVFGFEQNAVVLVGVQRLLASALTAKAQPTEGNAGVAFFLQRELDDATDHVIVEQRDDLGDLRRGRAMGQHTINQLHDVAAQIAQRI